MRFLFLPALVLATVMVEPPAPAQNASGGGARKAVAPKAPVIEDTDKDGLISRDEFVRGAESLVFNRADTNRDGVVSGDEARMAQAGGLTTVIHPKTGVRTRVDIAAADRNRDGATSRDEFRRALAGEKRSGFIMEDRLVGTTPDPQRRHEQADSATDVGFRIKF